MEFARTKQGISVSQRMYVIDLLKETVSLVSQNMDNPLKEHLEAVYKVLRYLKKTPRKGLLFRKNGEKGIEAFTDVDWVGSIDDRRSLFGYCIMEWGNLVTWRSKKQHILSRSCVEADLKALAHRGFKVASHKKGKNCNGGFT
ncbi:secreted RxLR effector protein 161-like [Humulus lupulus]|uniref:secreted RxLR effector protein 161-like n=1 Tax=Humulus lupulus TaxID=3486 RepID=UPI002B410B5D|nr:secreted RxLR effector protein 161-like [Humulus lupulus]